jgi:hypothetical protein
LRIDFGQQLYSILIVKGKVSIVKWESLEYTDFVGIEKENLIEWLRQYKKVIAFQVINVDIEPVKNWMGF